MDKPGIWTEDFKIRSFQADFNGNLSLPALLGIFQETAGEHADAFSLGYENMIKNNWAWVLSRIKVRIYRIPRWKEIVSLRTWVKERTRLLSIRHFEIFSEKREKLLGAVSEWALVNIETKKPVFLTNLNLDFPFYPEMRALEERPEKLIPSENMSFSGNYTVKNSDVDVNMHMNNAQYLRVVLDSYEVTWLKKFRIEVFDINFKAEAMVGDELTLKTRSDGNLFLHSVERKKDKRPVALLKLKWEEQQ
ncbi:MAG: hypothetical protein J7L62_01410 [Candidatus Aminicenantes bacterium]|nr:hypothetical protein [Candidatus Aminicenantes bacterium]